MINEVIPVVFSTDENYVPYCGVAILSLIKNTSGKNRIEVYVLYDKLTKFSIHRLELLSENNVQVKCLCVHQYIKDLRVQEYNHLTIASAFRLVIPKVLNMYDKVLYLDSDIAVNADVCELFETDLKDNILGAAKGYIKSDDGFMELHIEKNLKISVDSFFNAGILVINTKKFEEFSVAEKCMELLSTRKDLYFMDQCALNIVCENRVTFFDQKWNYEWIFITSSDNPFMSKDYSDVVTEEPCLIHYDGTEKPWKHPDWPLASYFWKIARESCFYEEILMKTQINATKEVASVVRKIGDARNIVIYGAGNIGKSLVAKIQNYNLYNIAAWVDKNYKTLNNLAMEVSSIDCISDFDFDCVVIAIENSVVVDEVRKQLIDAGISANKIIPYC